MRVLFVTSSYPTKDRPQYCIYLEQQARALKAQGNQVEILLISKETGMAAYRQNDLLVRKMGLGSLRIEKIAVLPRNQRRLRAFPWQDYDVVSLHLGRISYLSLIVDLCNEKRVKVIQHFHGLNVWEEYCAPSTLRHKAFLCWEQHQKKKMLKKCSAVVGVSNLVCEEIRRKIKKTEVYTVYNGVDCSRFYPLERNEDREEYRIICVANLIPLKGQEYLLEAIHFLRDRRNIRLHLIGEGPDRQRLECRSRELGIENQVVFLGERDYIEVARRMRESDMFIMPSCYEAFGCVFLEAMCSGILTCGCEYTGAQEIITDGENGLLLKQRDPASVAGAISFAMDQKEAAREIAEQGRRRAMFFSWEQSAAALQEVYETI